MITDEVEDEVEAEVRHDDNDEEVVVVAQNEDVNVDEFDIDIRECTTTDSRSQRSKSTSSVSTRIPPCGPLDILNPFDLDPELINVKDEDLLDISPEYRMRVSPMGLVAHSSETPDQWKWRIRHDMKLIDESKAKLRKLRGQHVEEVARRQKKNEIIFVQTTRAEIEAAKLLSKETEATRKITGKLDTIQLRWRFELEETLAAQLAVKEKMWAKIWVKYYRDRQTKIKDDESKRKQAEPAVFRQQLGQMRFLVAEMESRELPKCVEDRNFRGELNSILYRMETVEKKKKEELASREKTRLQKQNEIRERNLRDMAGAKAEWVSSLAALRRGHQVRPYKNSDLPNDLKLPFVATPSSPVSQISFGNSRVFFS